MRCYKKGKLERRKPSTAYKLTGEREKESEKNEIDTNKIEKNENNWELFHVVPYYAY